MKRGVDRACSHVDAVLWSMPIAELEIDIQNTDPINEVLEFHGLLNEEYGLNYKYGRDQCEEKRLPNTERGS